MWQNPGADHCSILGGVDPTDFPALRQFPGFFGQPGGCDGTRFHLSSGAYDFSGDEVLGVFSFRVLMSSLVFGD